MKVSTNHSPPYSFLVEISSFQISWTITDSVRTILAVCVFKKKVQDRPFFACLCSYPEGRGTSRGRGPLCPRHFALWWLYSVCLITCTRFPVLWGLMSYILGLCFIRTAGFLFCGKGVGSFLNFACLAACRCSKHVWYVCLPPGC